MLIFAKFTNAEDPSNHYTFVDDADPDFVVVAGPTSIDMQINERTVTDRDRMQLHGTNPTFSYSGGMSIDFTGDLYRDTSENYITERKALVYALRGVPDTQPSVRKRGVLELQWAGDAESGKLDVTITKISMPITGGYPAYTQYMITFFAFKPWFTGSSTGDLYYMD